MATRARRFLHKRLTTVVLRAVVMVGLILLGVQRGLPQILLSGLREIAAMRHDFTGQKGEKHSQRPVFELLQIWSQIIWRNLSSCTILPDMRVAEAGDRASVPGDAHYMSHSSPGVWHKHCTEVRNGNGRPKPPAWYSIAERLSVRRLCGADQQFPSHQGPQRAVATLQAAALQTFQYAHCPAPDHNSHRRRSLR